MCAPSITTWQYGRTLSAFTFTMIWNSTEEISNSLVENRNPLPRRETELRKNEMKLRKNEIISPKSFSVPHWKIKDHHGGIHDLLRRDWFIFIMRQSCYYPKAYFVYSTPKVLPEPSSSLQIKRRLPSAGHDPTERSLTVRNSKRW